MAPPGTSTVAESATSTVTDTVTTSSQPQLPVPTEKLPQQQDASGAKLSITEVRVAEHPGFDRVVFEFGGTGTPGWDVDFTTDPRREGSGEPIDILGESVIRVTINGAGYPDDVGVPSYDGPNPVAGVGGVTQVVVEGPFEGQSVSFIGVNANDPNVRVSALSSPTRLVLDIAR